MFGGLPRSFVLDVSSGRGVISKEVEKSAYKGFLGDIAG
jgi:hypothetical protein